MHRQFKTARHGLDAMSPNGPTRDAVLEDSRDEVGRDQVRDSRGAGRSCVAVVGIDRYRTWNRLYNAVSDARGALGVFRHFGFELLGTALYDEQATGDALRRLVTDDLSVLGPDDSLILFFAGHGHTVIRTYHGGATVNDGYIIPVDGDRPGGRAGTWLRLESWLSDITRIPAKHILVVIDACHSGLALGPVIQWRSRGFGSELREPLEQLSARRSRRIITSALEDQVAMDGGPILGHSLFTGCLIEALTGGLMAKSGRSTVTGSEVAQYVQRRVSEYPHSTQTPDFGALALDDRGELLIRLAPMENSATQLCPPQVPAAPLLPASGATQDLADASPKTTMREHSQDATPNVARVQRRLVKTLKLSAAVAVSAAGLLLWRTRNTQPDDAAALPLVHPVAPDAAASVARNDARLDDAGLDVPALSTITRANPFIAVDGVRVLSHQVTRREYATYLATLSPELRTRATPRQGWNESALDGPLAWTRFEQAVAFCGALGGHLPTFAEWNRASRGSWGIDPVGDQRGPLREWTAEVDEGWIRVAGATATMTDAQRIEALKDKLLLGSAANFADRIQPDEVDVSSREVGIRCVRD